MKDLLQRVAAFILAVRDAEDTPDDIRETAEQLLEEVTVEVENIIAAENS